MTQSGADLEPVIEALSEIIELDPWKDSPKMATVTKTPAKDPFKQAANAEGNGQPAKDPFGQPATGGGFPKVADLFGHLLMVTPIKIAEVPDFQDKTKMREQLTAHVDVIDGPPPEYAGDEPSTWVGRTLPNMWLNNKTLVSAAAAAMAEGTPAILGRLWRFPTSDDVKAGKYTDRHDLEAKMIEANKAWRPGQPPLDFRYALGLEKYTDEEAQLAREFIAAKAAKSGS
jgi:hypothetical protein